VRELLGLTLVELRDGDARQRLRDAGTSNAPPTSTHPTHHPRGRAYGHTRCCCAFAPGSLEQLEDELSAKRKVRSMPEIEAHA
jgi:hypothetical protein